MPRRIAWILFGTAALLFFMAALKSGGAAPSLPSWLEDGGLCSLAVGCLLWALPVYSSGQVP